ncbi:MAG: TIM-barrel domain-containing protein [Bacteroidota bacterium]
MTSFLKYSLFLITLAGFNWSGTCQGTLISDMDLLKWEKVAPGVWKATFGEMGMNPTDYTSPPKMESLSELGESPFPFNEDSTFSQLTAERAIIRLPLEKEEKIYGLGLEFESINRRSNVYTLKVDHYGGVKGYTHAPVPFYVSSKGYGVLINSAKRVKIYAGIGNRKDSDLPPRIDRTTGGREWAARPVSDAVEASVQGDGLEVYVFSGQEPLEAVQRYNLFFGGGVLPPKWGLGFWHRVHTTSTAEDVLKEIEAFETNNFPLDVIGLEPGWQSFAYPCSFDWDSTRFPDPKGFMNSLSAKGIKVNLWENPYVAPVSSMYTDIHPFTGSHTVWLGEVPDYSIPEARKILLDHHKQNHINIGVSGYKFDEVDGYDFWLWPDHATFPSGNDAVEIRQLYGLILQNTFTNYFKSINQRTYGLVRSSYIGASSQNFVIYSDYYGHEGYVTALVNSSLAGILWTPEIRSAGSAEEWIRRFQTVCFSPFLMLNAWSSGKKPWSYPEVTDMVRENIELRMKLMPYLYTAFYEYNQKGIPPFRAMILESGFDENTKSQDGKLDDVKNPYAEKKTIEKTDQYMMGPSILVAPVFTGQKERTIDLPNGNWYDFYTGELAGNGETITIQTELAKIPLYVKEGAIIPMLASLADEDSGHLQVRHYGSTPSSFMVYNDDGESYDFEKGEYSMTELTVLKDVKGKLKYQSRILNSKEYGYDQIEWVGMAK